MSLVAAAAAAPSEIGATLPGGTLELDRENEDDNEDCKSSPPYRPAAAEILEEVRRKMRAYKFVERLKQAVDEMRTTYLLVEHEISAIENFQLFERLLKTTKQFKGRQQEPGMPQHRVDIGYHYTRLVNITPIQTNGLLSRPDREAANIATNFNGSVYGEGVYVANSPYGFHGQRYGDVGLLVARLKGVPHDPAKAFDGSCDCIVVNPGQWNEFCVLDSCQCLPLVQFDAQVLINPSKPDSDRNKAVFSLQIELQQVVDEFFNQEHPTLVTNWQTFPTYCTNNTRKRSASTVAAMPATTNRSNSLLLSATASAGIARSAPKKQRRQPGNSRKRGAPAAVTRTINGRSLVAGARGVARSAPKKRHLDQHGCGTIQYQSPETMPMPGESALVTVRNTKYSVLSKQCTICLDALSRHGKIAQLPGCGHLFHKQCLHDCLQQSPHCPICRTLIGKPQGKMPSGDMKILWINTSCEGYESVGTIVLNYHIPKGIQKPYHQNPGQGHDSATRTAYLPDSDEGNQLLKRLKYAFQHGLTFTVGTSLTTGRPNSVTWSSIHHKTYLRGGVRVHGYPDPNFFSNCNLELDALAVPSADHLDAAGRENHR